MVPVAWPLFKDVITSPWKKLQQYVNRSNAFQFLCFNAVMHIKTLAFQAVEISIFMVGCMVYIYIYINLYFDSFDCRATSHSVAASGVSAMPRTLLGGSFHLVDYIPGYKRD